MLYGNYYYFFGQKLKKKIEYSNHPSRTNPKLISSVWFGFDQKILWTQTKPTRYHPYFLVSAPQPFPTKQTISPLPSSLLTTITSPFLAQLFQNHPPQILTLAIAITPLWLADSLLTTSNRSPLTNAIHCSNPRHHEALQGP